MRRMKRYYATAHAEADPEDYASYLAEAGEAEAGEGNRTREPTETERKEGDELELPWAPILRSSATTTMSPAAATPFTPLPPPASSTTNE